MNRDAEYFLVDVRVLPGVFRKVIEVKKHLALGEDTTINDAARDAGISRSAYYKYKDFVFPFYETSRGKVITLFFVLEDIPGILSGIIARMASAKANILTINQNIPINGLADLSISFETEEMAEDMKALLDGLGGLDGVRRLEIIAR